MFALTERLRRAAVLLHSFLCPRRDETLITFVHCEFGTTTGVLTSASSCENPDLLVFKESILKE